MNKARILLVDDEERILRSLGMLLRMHYEVFATSDGNEALAILKREKIHVIISDQRMPIMTGTELLQRARVIAPDTIRILLTGYADADAAVDAVNEGEIFRYISKPWGPKELRDTIAQAAEIAMDLQQTTAGAAEPELPVSATGITCLVLDEDEATYQTVREIVEPQQHAVLWARTFPEAMDILARTRVSILVTELSLGNTDLSAMVKTLKREHPEMLTIILTCFKDTARLVDLINQAQVFRYLPKPLRKGLLSRSMEACVVRFRSLQLRPAAVVAQKVEVPQDKNQQSESAKVAEYLARLRARVAASPTGRIV